MLASIDNLSFSIVLAEGMLARLIELDVVHLICDAMAQHMDNERVHLSAFGAMLQMSTRSGILRIHLLNLPQLQCVVVTQLLFRLRSTCTRTCSV